MTTGERMKNRRKALGFSAEYVAEKLGVSPATVYRYEKGDIEKVSSSILQPLSDILLTTPSYLMGWDEDSKEEPVLPDGPSREEMFRALIKTLSEDQKIALLKELADSLKK